MSKAVIEYSNIENQVYFIRGEKVMLDKDLAMLYGVETKWLNEQVKRNSDRFPIDFIPVNQGRMDSFEVAIPDLKRVGFEVAKCDLKKRRKKDTSICIYRTWCDHVS